MKSNSKRLIMTKFILISLFCTIIYFLHSPSPIQSYQTPARCTKQPYQTCNLGKPGHINVHLVSHTHNDLGWVKTINQYYNGTENPYNYVNYYEPTVKGILDSVIKELRVDPSRRFVYAEMGFFSLWWNEQTEITKAQVRLLVDQGRLEFIMGSWSMNDEATAYYSDIIDQHSLGFRFILEEFGSCARPRAAWQVDTFGHSNEQASLLSQFGYDGLFLGRIDYLDSQARSRAKNREFLWRPSKNLDQTIFTSVLPNVYWPPEGFCWESFCQPGDLVEEEPYLLSSRLDSFLKLVNSQARDYKTEHLIMTFGNDFTHLNAGRWLNNLDKLIKHTNQRQNSGHKVNIFHSTPACYAYSLSQQTSHSWKVNYDDFFPYADKQHSYWTGFFTSRPALKYNIRKSGSLLQTVRQLATLAYLNDQTSRDAIANLEKAMGVAQHHDAVTGTEKQHVANDYSKRLAVGVERSLKVIEQALNILARRVTGSPNHKQTPIIYCPLLNNTECYPTEANAEFNVIVYNQLARRIKSWITLPLVNHNYQVIDLDLNQLVVSDIAPVYPSISKIAERRSRASYRLVFEADLPAWGFKVYNVKRNSALPAPIDPLPSLNSEFVLRNDNFQLKFDTQGNLAELENLKNGLNTKVKQSFCYYLAMGASNYAPRDQSSGAYIFRPLPGSSHVCLRVRNYSISHLNRVTEVYQVFNDWISQIIRVYDGSTNVEFEWQIGPIDTDDHMGKEVITKFESDLQSSGLFYTDTNGREIITRRRDKKRADEPISSIYYPVNSQIFIRDETATNSPELSRRQLTLVTDRSQGGTSLSDGSFELMLHRRLLRDDSRGVEEPLDETGSNQKGLVVKGTVFLAFETMEQSASVYRDLARRVYNKPLVTFSLESNEILRYLSGYSALTFELPPNLHILTFAPEAPQTSNSILVRIEHLYERGEDTVLSQPMRVNLRELFSKHFRVVEVEELALGGNMKADELSQRLPWKADDNQTWRSGPRASLDMPQEFIFNFDPMQIRTFRVYYNNAK